LHLHKIVTTEKRKVELRREQQDNQTQSCHWESRFAERTSMRGI